MSLRRETQEKALLAVLILGFCVCGFTQYSGCLEKGHQKRAMQRSRLLGLEVFSAVRDGRPEPFSAWAETECQLAAQKSSEQQSRNSKVLEGENLRELLRAMHFVEISMDDLEPLGELKLGAVCGRDVDGKVTGRPWFGSVGIVWSDGYFIGRPTGLGNSLR